jgi:hypothetical protein
MAGGRFAKVVTTAEMHPVVRVLSLASVGAFVIGLVIAIVKALSHWGFGYVLAIAVPLGVLAMCLAFLYYHSVKPAEIQATPAPTTPDPPVSTHSPYELIVETPPPPEPVFVVDDRSATFGWIQEDDWAIVATCRIFCTNHTGDGVRILKTHLKAAGTHGTVRDEMRGFSVYGVWVDDDQMTPIICQFVDIPAWVLNDDHHKDVVEITDEQNTMYEVSVCFKRGRASRPPIFDDEPF